jgi:hypothetical protein
LEKNMKIRTQLKGCVFAGSLCSALIFSHVASAAHTDAASSASSTSKTQHAAVKRSAEQIVPALSTLPPRLRLTEPAFVAPAAQVTATSTPALPNQARKERLILGLRLPTFIAFGLGGLSAGGAVATGFAATRGNDPSHCDSRCTDHDVRRRALLLTTGVLTGLAAAGVSVGITFMLKAPKNPTRDAIRPRLGIGFSGNKAVAKIGWSFSSF